MKKSVEIKKCQLRQLQNQILFSSVTLQIDAHEAGAVSCWRFTRQQTER